MESFSPLKSDVKSCLHIHNADIIFKIIYDDIFNSYYFDKRFLLSFCDNLVIGESDYNKIDLQKINFKNKSFGMLFENIFKEKKKKNNDFLYEFIINNNYAEEYLNLIDLNINIMSDCYKKLKQQTKEYNKEFEFTVKDEISLLKENYISKVLFEENIKNSFLIQELLSEEDILKGNYKDLRITIDSPDNIDYILFKSAFSSIYEYTAGIYPELLLFLNLIMNGIINLDFCSTSNTLYMIRNSFQHSNEIINKDQFNLYKSKIINYSKLYTNRELSEIYDSFSVRKKDIILFNYYNDKIKMFTFISFSDLIKYCITSMHVLRYFVNLKTNKKMLVYSHDFLLDLFRRYKIYSSLDNKKMSFLNITNFREELIKSNDLIIFYGDKNYKDKLKKVLLFSQVELFREINKKQ